MPGSTNFLQFNPPANNQETDATYVADATRLGGIVFNQIMSSLLGNKILYQSSIMTAALAGALVAKGFSPNDGSAAPATALRNLEGVLGNILTTADTVVPGVVVALDNFLGGQGAVNFGTIFGGLVINFGSTGIFSTTPKFFPLHIAFPEGFCLGLYATSGQSSGGQYFDMVYTTSPSQGFNIYGHGAAAPYSAFWLAIGH
jgi:hypothetical protein